MADIVSFSEEKEKVKTKIKTKSKKKKEDSGESELDMTLINIVHELHIIRDHSKGALLPILTYVEGYRVGLEKSLRTVPLYSVLKKALEEYNNDRPKI